LLNLAESLRSYRERAPIPKSRGLAAQDYAFILMLPRSSGMFKYSFLRGTRLRMRKLASQECMVR
jgi:hypothetical protein